MGLAGVALSLVIASSCPAAPPPQFKVWGTAGPELKPIPSSWKPARPEPSPFLRRVFAPKETEIGFALFAQEPFAPMTNQTSTSAAAGELQISAFATPGEYEPLAAGIYALEDCSQIEAEISELHSPASGSISSDNLDLRVTRTVPTLVDAATKTYRLEPFLIEKRPKFALEKDAARLLWLTVHVPQSAVAGKYEGTLSVRRPGRGVATARILLTVLPFSLPALPFETTMYYPRPSDSDPMLERELVDMREHGTSVPIPAMEVRVRSRDQKFGPDDVDETRTYCQRLLGAIHRVYGAWRFPVTFEAGHQVVYYWDQSRNWFAYWPHSPALEKDLGKGIELMLELARSNGIPALRAYLSDEGGAHNLLDETVYYNRWVKDHFPQVQTTATIGGGLALGFDEIGELAGAVDLFSANRFTPEVARALTALRRPFAVYNGAGSRPAGARFFFGFYGYKTGAQQIGQWSYSFGESVFQGNGLRLEDEGYVYHAPDGPLPSLMWEAVREGIDDSRYSELLWQMIGQGQASQEAAVRQAAEHAKEILDTVFGDIGWEFQAMQNDQRSPAPDASILAKWRWQIAEQILALREHPISMPGKARTARVSPLELPWAKAIAERLSFGPELLTNSTLETSLSPWRVEAWKGTGKGELDAVERHSGRQAVRIRIPVEDGSGAVTVLVWPQYGDHKLDLTLEGNRTYEFSVWAKWRDRSLPPRVRISLPAAVVAATKSGQTPPDERGWCRLWARAKLNSTARPGYLAVWIQGPGTVWLDDLSLREIQRSE
ncbi:MAG TPA: hypothetical protein VJA21_06170 [Verrucomicrobiae bacterium]